jgi:hypothetical protein
MRLTHSPFTHAQEVWLFLRLHQFFSPPGQQGCQMVYFQTKITIWVNFRGPCNGRCWYVLAICFTYFKAIWYILWPFSIFYVHFIIFYGHLVILLPFGIFYGHMVYFMAIWYNFW